VPIYLWDPVRLAVGISHAGWKGTVSSIASKSVQAMVQAYGSSPEHIHVTIGPSIGMCCYEVNQDVARQVQPFAHRNNKENPLIIPCGRDKYKIDLKETNRQILLKAGILADHIELTKLCTSCDNDYLFSHRKENGQTGRMAAWIGLNLERGDHAFESA
jgi:YfiH family protein